MDPFVFDSYSIDETGRGVSFRYRFGLHSYEERIILNQGSLHLVPDKDLLDRILFNLHLALGISYWKANCSPHMEIRSGHLSEGQATFWNTIYTKGLGEFYFRNKIDFRSLVRFPSSSVGAASATSIKKNGKLLVGIGGGKDSVVVWELLKEQQKEITGLTIKTQHSYQAVEELIAKMHLPTLGVERIIDPSFIKESKSHTYNGHVPISMIYAWIGILVSYVAGFDAFVVANEKSADEGNTDSFGMEINHQWSKSGEFEGLFRDHLHATISPDLDYYSPIRHMTELEIVGKCVSYPQYLPYITSCNRNFSITKQLQQKKWCGECPKCAFAFLLFAAHLPKHTVVSLFGKNMLEDVALDGLFRDLEGRGGLKPFECVGTFEEAREALGMIVAKNEFNLTHHL